ncbi:MAG: hypothetical protein HN348_05200, partial [Proteobacteria bacterium]|nr:hypothetical protein [Pseudomonadota bacterium]
MSRRSLLPFLALFIGLSASAVPMEFNHQGRLMDATGIPLQGPHDLTVSVYDGEGASSSAWTETLDVDFDNGYFAIQLGEDEFNPLEDALFSSDDLWLGVSVDGGPELDARVQIASVPFARRAATAVNVSGGIVDASEILVDGNVVINKNGVYKGTDTLSALNCGIDEHIVHDGSDWLCLPVTYHFDDLEGVPADLADGDDDYLADLVCLDGEIVVWDDVDQKWFCGEDATLIQAEVLDMVDSEVIHLGAGSTVDGTFISTMTDADVRTYLDTANDINLNGQTTLGGVSIDDFLNEAEVKSLLNTANDIDLNGSTALGGTPLSDFLTEAELKTTLSSATDLDLNGATQLDGSAISDFLNEAELKTTLTNATDLDLNSATQLNGAAISDFLTETELKTTLTNATDLDLNSATQLNGSAISDFLTVAELKTTLTNATDLDLNGATELNGAAISDFLTETELKTTLTSANDLNLNGATQLDGSAISDFLTVAELKTTLTNATDLDLNGATELNGAAISDFLTETELKTTLTSANDLNLNGATQLDGSAISDFLTETELKTTLTNANDLNLNGATQLNGAAISDFQTEAEMKTALTSATDLNLNANTRLDGTPIATVAASDTAYVNVGGDTMTGGLEVQGLITGAANVTKGQTYSKNVRVTSRGIYSAGSNSVFVDGVSVQDTGRSYGLTVITRATGEVDFTDTFDLFGNPAEAQRLADKLAAYSVDHIVIINTYDEPAANRTLSGLPDQIFRCGGTDRFLSLIDYRSAYLLVGICDMGPGTGIEMFNDRVNGADQAEFNFLDTSFNIIDGNLQTTGAAPG